MCFELDSSPPIAVLSAGGDVTREDLVLGSADGAEFAAFAAEPQEAAWGSAGIVILPDVRGLYRFYEELALRFAERGYPAIAIDYFGRTAGVEKRGDDFEYPEHVQQTTPEGIQADVAAAVAYLRDKGATSVFTVGFCFGGRNSWLAAAGRHGLSGAVGFYGMPGERNGVPGPTAHASDIDAPILALQAGEDANITAEHNAAFDEALTAAGVEHEIVTYEGAPHSFFDRKQEEFAAASADAWQRTLDFIERHRT
jgi:carboxymethylenebutenolidase